MGDVLKSQAGAEEAARLQEGRHVVEGLRRHLEASDPAGAVELLETHASWVLLAGRFAYKLKKPVCLGFLDFRTLDARRCYCEEELRLNQRLAPTLYLSVLPVRGTSDEPRLGGDGPDLDYVVWMRRFPAGALLSERLAADAVPSSLIDRLARRLATFHETAPVADPHTAHGSAEVVAAGADATLQGLRALGRDVSGLDTWLAEQARVLTPAWAARRAAGRVRECHGDLHLGNVVVLGDEAVAFDCLEFAPALRWIDVANDLAFLAMDLAAHGRSDLAWRALNEWLDHTGDHQALPVLHFYMMHRALVRGLVLGIQAAQQAETSAGRPDYLQLARQLLIRHRGPLLLMHGVSGSGKTWVSGRLLELTGAVRLRSDVERKRLFGMRPAQRAETGAQTAALYDDAANQRTYDRLLALAGLSLDAGYPTIVDAAFLRREERQRFERMARDRGVPFLIVQCEAAPPTLQERVRVRRVEGRDASDADETVLARQWSRIEALDDGERMRAVVVDTSNPLRLRDIVGRWLPGTGAEAADGAEGRRPV
ncbi:AAA family ATPase [Aquabacterium sp. A7-Y]|uniref:bifunctional aminoglycoside phosphotransferase/ATP-binding protein n=1 Tax=Aquabacterium sp. A7-Y TaxID=1349605 RepID=UPI00223D2292|nr:AAA family ATPase [Aquabacterium sp. A7-Y]MCW7541125.1 AAA family ATPase [Aquabacterium sp. A7-Y]